MAEFAMGRFGQASLAVCAPIGVALFVMAVPALAQTVELQVGEPDGGWLWPDTQNEVPFEVVWTGPTGVACEYTVIVEAAAGPEYAQVEVIPGSFDVTDDGPFVGVVRITMIGHAPAFENGDYAFAARSETTTTGCPTNQGGSVAELAWKNAFAAELGFQTGELEADGGRLMWPIQIQNLGNGPTKVSVTAAPDRASIVLPESATLRMQAAAVSTATSIGNLTFEVDPRTPDTMVRLVVVATFDGETSGTNVKNARYALEAQLPDGAADAPGPASITLMVVAAALVAWRRRRSA